MRYNLATKKGIINCRQNVAYHTKKGSIIEQKAIKKTLSSTQMRALHLYFKFVADALLEVGYSFIYTNPFTGELIEIPYTKDLVKVYIWKPLQETMFKIESTTKLETNMINDILTALTPWLGNINKLVKFPNRIDYLIDKMNKSNNY